MAAEPDSEILANAASGSIFRSYNLLLDMAAERDDLEALVLAHQDAEIQDPDFCKKRPCRAVRSRGRRGGLRGGDRRAQHRLVGGVGHLGVVHPPLRRARRR